MPDTIELKDYLHYYLGCEVESNFNRKRTLIGFAFRNGERWPLIQDSSEEYERIGQPYSVPFNELKLILRPLSDMTDEEWGENGLRFSVDVFEAVRSPKLHYSDKPRHVLVLENRLYTNTLRFNDGIILLKMGFDLFGLIDAGLAIDKTKL